MATAPKSNALYRAYGAVVQDVKNSLAEPVPLHLRNAPTKLMKELDYGKGYQYAHDFQDKLTGMSCLPKSLEQRVYFAPSDEGFEQTVQERLKSWREKVRQLKDRKK
jgi:putative ATPase